MSVVEQQSAENYRRTLKILGHQALSSVREFTTYGRQCLRSRVPRRIVFKVLLKVVGAAAGCHDTYQRFLKKHTVTI